MTDQRIDDRISKIVNSLDRNVPAEVDARVRAAAESRRGRRAGRWRHKPLWLTLVPGAAVVLLAALILLPVTAKKAAAPISEIRTEFELAGKDIKIIFFQKPDFNLFQED